jgi:hypothetical protein
MTARWALACLACACACDRAVPPEVDGRLVINELMAANAVTVPEHAGDWVEIYNPTEFDVPLDGYALTDDLGAPRKLVLAGGLVAPAGGHVVLWLDGDTRLAREGGELGFARPDGTYIDRLTYGAQAVDLSAARSPDGWRIEWHATPGAANPDGDGAPVEGDEIEAVPAAGDVSERILGYDVLLELELLIGAEDARALEQNPYRYVPATLVFDGRAYGPVGVRLKGQNSFQPFSMKPSFRINVDEYVPGAELFGLEDLTLNNMDNDRSMMHERLAYRVARQAGLPASRANHALVTVNGQLYGLYTNVETVKRRMLARWFATTDGALFEGTNVDLAARYVPAYEHEAGPDDRSLLWGTAEALTMGSADEAMARAGEFTDLPQFRRYWAFCAVVGQFDALPYSDPGDDYLVYADAGRLHFIPWGMDETFYSSATNVTAVRSVLASRCKESPACMQDYTRQVWDLVAMIEAGDLAAERTRVAAQIAPYVTRDTRKPYADATVAEYQEHLRRFITSRRAKLSAMLPPP